MTRIVVLRLLADTGKVEMAKALFHTQEVNGLDKDTGGTTKKSQIGRSPGGKGNSTKQSKEKHKQSKW